MSIDVNGVTLPDIPADLLANYPYAVIFDILVEHEGELTTSAYYLYVSTSEFIYGNKGLMSGEYENYELVGSMANGKTASYTGILSDWNVSSDEVPAGSLMMPIGNSSGSSSVIKLIWSNHDIYELTKLDLETGRYNFGGMYFRNPSDPLPERVSVPSSFVKDIADVFRVIMYPAFGMQRLDIDSIQFLAPYLKTSYCTVQNFVAVTGTGSRKVSFPNVYLFNWNEPHTIIDFNGFRYYGQWRSYQDPETGENLKVFGNKTLIGGSESSGTSFAKMPFCIVEPTNSLNMRTDIYIRNSLPLNNGTATIGAINFALPIDA